MSKIFKPRRGKASTMNGTKSSTVLAAGEMFIELPDTGVGTGTCKMKMGDGVTAYGSLPYAMGGDIATTEITGGINDDTSSTATAALANVTTGKTLGSIIGSLRRACSLNAEAIATLNDEKVNCFTITNIDAGFHSPTGFWIGNAIVDNADNAGAAYINLEVGWVILQFRIQNNAISVREKYGNSPWCAWKCLVP